MDDKENFGVRMEDQLKEWKQRIEDSKAEAKDKGDEYYQAYGAILDALSEKYEDARYRLKLFRMSGGDALGELKTGFDKAFDELKNAASKAWGKF